MRVVIEVDDIDRLADVLSKRGTSFISPRATSVAGLPYGKCFLVKDPNGHAVMLVQR
jgi:predicted enzyme related to lactoylglutathione lyase